MDNPAFNPAAQATGKRIARCACGSVEIEAFGVPIASVVCYCDTCQKGSRQLEALDRAVPILGPDGGTAYILYRKVCTKFKPDNAAIPTDIPSAAMYPGGFFWKLLTSRISMLMGR